MLYSNLYNSLLPFLLLPKSEPLLEDQMQIYCANQAVLKMISSSDSTHTKILGSRGPGFLHTWKPGLGLLQREKYRWAEYHCLPTFFKLNKAGCNLQKWVCCKGRAMHHSDHHSPHSKHPRKFDPLDCL